MKPTIEVNELSKSYFIRHRQKSEYGSLRDDISRLASRALRRTKHKSGSIEKFWALKDVTFSVSRGEVLGIIGRNGSGKSTLLKVLSKITDPTSGSAIMRGKTASLLEVGTGFHPELTGRENIYFNGSILGMSKREISQKFNDIVEFAEIEKFLDTPVKFYSSGMYVRLAFAVAAHLEPDILIVDEVLAVGDAQFQKKCLGKMETASQEGRTVLFVSHNMETVHELCSRAILLENGRIEAEGEVNHVIKAYTGTGASTGRFSKFRTQRFGEQKIRIEKITLSTNEGKVSGSFEYKNDINLLFEVESQLQKVSGIRVDINVYNDNSTHIACFSTHGHEASLVGNSLKIHLSDLMLAPGNYSASISLLRNTTDLQDLITHAIRFEILPTTQVVTGIEGMAYGEAKII